MTRTRGGVAAVAGGRTDLPMSDLSRPMRSCLRTVRAGPGGALYVAAFECAVDKGKPVDLFVGRSLGVFVAGDRHVMGPPNGQGRRAARALQGFDVFSLRFLGNDKKRAAGSDARGAFSQPRLRRRRFRSIRREELST
jgi:hypothetical protein